MSKAEQEPLQAPQGFYELLRRHNGLELNPGVKSYLGLRLRMFDDPEHFRRLLKDPWIEISEATGCACINVLCLYQKKIGEVRGFHAHVREGDEVVDFEVTNFDLAKKDLRMIVSESPEELSEMSAVIQEAISQNRDY